MTNKIHRMPGVIPGRLPAERAPKRRSGRLGFTLVVLGLVAGIYWCFFLGPTFAVKSVDITGSSDESIQPIANRLIGVNIFRLNAASIEQDIRHVYPAIESITLVRGLPNVARLNIKLRTPALRWQIHDTIYVMDSGGQIFKEGDKPEYADLPKLIDKSGKELQIGQQIVSPAFIQIVQDIEKQIPDYFNRSYTTVEITETTFHLDVILEGDVRIRLTTQRPAPEQLEAAKKIISQHPEVKMIDVRIARWGYWK